MAEESTTPPQKEEPVNPTAMWRSQAPAKYARAQAHGCYEEWEEDPPTVCVDCCLPPLLDPLAILLKDHQFSERVDPTCRCGWNAFDERWDDWEAWVRAENLTSFESTLAWQRMRPRYHAEHVAAIVEEHLSARGTTRVQVRTQFWRESRQSWVDHANIWRTECGPFGGLEPERWRHRLVTTTTTLGEWRDGRALSTRP